MAKRMRVRGRVGTVIAAALVAALSLLPAAGGAAPPPLPPLEPSPPPAPPDPVGPSPTPAPSASPSPDPRPSPTSGRPRSSPSPDPSPAATKGRPDPYDGAVAEGLAYWSSLPKTPPRSTLRLLELFDRLQPPGRSLTTEAIARGVGRFPVAGYVWYQDDWAAPRYLPYFHLHEGTDLFAEAGTPAIASWDGVVAKLATGSIGGTSIWLDGDDGVTYYYGHLLAYAPGVRAGRRVRTGDVIGYVGDSGIAQGTYPHVHFEIHPLGGAPVPPKPTLDRWLTLAEERAENHLRLRAREDAVTRAGAARWHRLAELVAEPGAVPPLLWPSVLDPARASDAFADSALRRLAGMLEASRARTPPLGGDGSSPLHDPLAFLEGARGSS